MITKIYDNYYTYEVGVKNVGYITEWSVGKDTVDIFRIADENNKIIVFHGYTHKDYVVEHDDEPIEDGQITLFDLKEID
ncbi:hypothetical protein NGB30_01675 [Mammaliicoccus fleurettii]|uniref:hypothetical protein n=1 Tax=Mammaliicoccus fleurettii TaxID=150056 RepID=UPI002DBF056A|nr:hypothetical protein [Mammaliicoccus fleurettii]MEB7779241.1 hypothetical protein [Mammaliicoccus fleurettii]